MRNRLVVGHHSEIVSVVRMGLPLGLSLRSPASTTGGNIITANPNKKVLDNI